MFYTRSVSLNFIAINQLLQNYAKNYNCGGDHKEKIMCRQSNGTDYNIHNENMKEPMSICGLRFSII